MSIIKPSLLPLLIALVIGCGFNQNIPKGCEGIYANGNDTIVLSKDGTFLVNENGRTTKGEFSIDGNEIKLRVGSNYAFGMYDGRKIIDNEGKTWMKQ